MGAIINPRWSAIRRGRGDLPPIVANLEFFGDLSSPRTSIVSGAVATLGDSSGNARDFTQSTSTKRPTYSSSDANFGGRPSMTCDGVDDFLLRATAFAAMSNITIYIVHKGSTYTSFDHMFAIDNAPNDGSVVIYLDAAATLFGVRYNHPSGAGNLSVRDITGSATLAQRLAYSGALSTGGALWTTYLNGASSGSNIATLASSGGASSTANAAIGAIPTGSQNFATTFTDILVYSSAHSAAQVTAIDDWLKWRNGL